MKRTVDFNKAKDALLKLTAADIAEIRETIVIQDESSALDSSNILNMEYGFPRSGNAKKGQDCRLGKLCCIESATADGDDLEFPEGMPAILLTHFSTKEYKGESTGGAECAAPSISINRDGNLMSIGIMGYKFGNCDQCPRNVFDETTNKSLRCMRLNRFVVLTAYPDSAGIYRPVMVQFKGDGVASTPLKNSLIKIVSELRGKIYSSLIKVDTKEKTGTYEDEKGKPQSYTAWLYTFEKVKDAEVKQEKRGELISLKETLLSYYYDQHMVRIRLYAADSFKDQLKKPDLLAKPAETAGAIENKTSVLDASGRTVAKAEDDGFGL